MGIKYFLIIDIDVQAIEIYTLNNQQYQVTNYIGKAPYLFLLEDDCKIEIELSNIWQQAYSIR